MSNPITWSVRVDWQQVTLNETEVDLLLGSLVNARPTLTAEREEDGHPTVYSLTVHVDGQTLRQAIATALRLVEDATGHRAHGVEALPQHELVRQLAKPNVPALVGQADIADMLGVTRQRAAQLTATPGFPPAVMTIKAGPLRVRDQVEDWAQTWTRKAGRPAKATTGGVS